MSTNIELESFPTVNKDQTNLSESIELTTLPRTSHPSSTTHEPPTKRQIRKENIYIAALCYCLFLAGWNDGTTGPLLPRIQEHYHVGFAVVSMLFVGNCVGFISAGFLNVHLTDRFGFGMVVVVGAAFQVVAYSIQSSAPPFPVLVIGYLLNGFGIALQDAQANGFVASLPTGSAAKMGILHAVYGVGALASPLVATQFSQSPRHWSFHYLTSLGVALANLIVLIWVFRFRVQDNVLQEIGISPVEHGTSEESKYKQILGLKLVHLLAVFVLVYVGTEVTVGGWIVTYIVKVRGGGPSAGYVSSGFFAGLTLGRVVLLWVNQKIGERRVIYLYSVLAIGLEITIWFVPSLIGNAIAVSFVGLLLGPFYPVCMNVAGALLPRWLLTGSIGWIASFGQAGSAVFPFLTGALAQKYGVKVMQPLLVAMMAFLIALWALVPKHARRSD